MTNQSKNTFYYILSQIDAQICLVVLYKVSWTLTLNINTEAKY